MNGSSGPIPVISAKRSSRATGVSVPECGADTIALRRDLRKLDYAARRQFLKAWNLREGSRKSLWDADHILPVAEGGGQCDLANMRTLCLKCHREATAALRKRLRGLQGAGFNSTLIR